MRKVKVTSKGQITLPAELREKLKIQEGDYLDAWVHNDSLLLKPVPRQDSGEMIREYSARYANDDVNVEQARRVLGKVPFSLSERASKSREEE